MLSRFWKNRQEERQIASEHPTACPSCGHSSFWQNHFGLANGPRGSGVTYGVECAKCGAKYAAFQLSSRWGGIRLQDTDWDVPSRRLFTVEKTFVVDGDRLGLLPGFLPAAGEHFRVGDPLVLMRPNGTRLEVPIAGFLVESSKAHEELVVMLAGVKARDAPYGTIIHSR